MKSKLLQMMFPKQHCQLTYFVEATYLGLQNPSDHQTLSVYGHVGFHVITMSQSRSILDMFANGHSYFW